MARWHVDLQFLLKLSDIKKMRLQAYVKGSLSEDINSYFQIQSALLQLHLHSRLNTWLQWFGQRLPQDWKKNI